MSLPRKHLILCLPAAVFISLACCGPFADDKETPAASGSPESLEAAVRETLGAKWNVSRKNDELLIERKTRPINVNMTSRDPHEA
jgi:hypothetical protein